MAKLANRAKMTISSTGTGNITLAAADTGYQTFAQAGISDGDVIRYIVEDASNAWEIGTAVVSSSSTVLARTVEESSSGGSALNLTSAAKVFVGVTAKDLDNAAPIFTTTPPTSLNLANDGSTAVTLNAKAYDESAGIPVSYSWDAWHTDGTTIYDATSLPPQFASAPSINQSTGVFSIIGSSNSANVGVVNFRAKASDGVKIATALTVVTLDLPSPDLTNSTYSNTSLSVSSQDSSPLGLTFNTDGSRLFMVGANNDTVYQYDLSTNYNIGSASYNSVSFSVAGQDGVPRDVAFSSDGLKMFIAGTSNNRLFQYTLTTAFSLNTASYDNVSLDLSSQQSSGVTGCSFNATGTSVYTIGHDDIVFQFNLTSAYNLNNASYSNASFSVNSEDDFPKGVVISNSGKKMYVVGKGSVKVHQYTLSTPDLISSASYDSISADHSSQGSSPTGITFSSDSTKMFVSDNGNQTIFQYNL